MWRLLVDLFCASCAHLHQRRSCHCMSQWDTWQDHPPFQTSLLPCLHTWWNPYPPGPQKIRRGGASRKGNSGKTWRHVNIGTMGDPDRIHHWRQVQRCWLVDLYNRGNGNDFPRWEKMKKDKHGKHCHKQRKYFLRSSYQLVGWWVRKPKSYSPLWVDSWPQKWTNPFCILNVGLMARL